MRQAAQATLKAGADLVAGEAPLWQDGLLKGLWEGPHPRLGGLIDGANEVAGLPEPSVNAQEARKSMQLLRHLCSAASRRLRFGCGSLPGLCTWHARWCNTEHHGVAQTVLVRVCQDAWVRWLCFHTLSARSYRLSYYTSKVKSDSLAALQGVVPQ